MADIFISYASEDQDCAAKVAHALESSGHSVWWDRRLRSGTDFTKEIGQQLDAARCVIVLWSKASVDSAWVRDEAAEGQRRQVLLPVKIEAVQPPYGFRGLQTASLVGWRGDAGAPEFVGILADLTPWCGGAGQQTPAASNLPSPVVTSPPSRARRGLRIGLGAVAVLALAGIFRFGYVVATQLATERAARAQQQELRETQAQRAVDEEISAARQLTARPTADGAAEAASAAGVMRLGPYATMRRAAEVDTLYRQLGCNTLLTDRADSYYVEVRC